MIRQVETCVRPAPLPSAIPPTPVCLPIVLITSGWCGRNIQSRGRNTWGFGGNIQHPTTTLVFIQTHISTGDLGAVATMGRTMPTIVLVLMTAASSTGNFWACHPYYVSQPTNTCVKDGEHASQGGGPVLLFSTKEECCNALTPKERRQCLKPEVPSEVYPDFEKGRCSSSTLRPAVVHLACAVDGSGVATSVGARFLKASLPVSDNEMCCRSVYGGIDEAAVERCVARRGTWHYVAGTGCVWDDPLADDPVVYSTAQTASSLTVCAETYFPRRTAFMCDAFPCPSTRLRKPGSIHCGSVASDCTRDVCCSPPDCSDHTCNPGIAYGALTRRTCLRHGVCPDTGCVAYNCCGAPRLELLDPAGEGTVTHPSTFPTGTLPVDSHLTWTLACAAGQVPSFYVESAVVGPKRPANPAIAYINLVCLKTQPTIVRTAEFVQFGGDIADLELVCSAGDHLDVTFSFLSGRTPLEGMGFRMRHKCLDLPQVPSCLCGGVSRRCCL